MRTKQTARVSRTSATSHICGLYFNDPNAKRHYLRQVNLDSHTTINPVCYQTQLKQTFHNPSVDTLQQVRYTFPLYDGVAVSAYTISFENETLKGVVKQKDAAKQTYQAAVDRGETAGLLESLPAGIFGVTLGNLSAKADVIVNIAYIGELNHDSAIDGLRYTLPTSIAPRYGDYPGELLSMDSMELGRISITVDIAMGRSAIRKAQSPSHPISVSMGALSKDSTVGEFNPGKASASLALGAAELADDFVLQLLVDDLSKPQAILEKHPSLPNRALMATLVPKFNLEPSRPEIVFIADQSGSMQGSKNTALVAALKVFLKSLPLGVRFNVCAFGSTFTFLWPKSQAYNETNMSTAMFFVSSLDASHGGTEILKPIVATFEQRLEDLPLEIMLLTDGEIWGENKVFDYINSQIHDKGVPARVFALGIGSDVSHTLVGGVARAGNGFSQFVTQNEETDQKVMRMLRGALYPHTSDYSIDVHYDKKDDPSTMRDNDDDDFELVEKVNDCLYMDTEVPTQDVGPDFGSKRKPISLFEESAKLDTLVQSTDSDVDRYAHLPAIETPKLLQAPSTIPPLFPFNRTTIYLLLGPETPDHKVSSVTLRAHSPQGPLKLTMEVDPEERVGTMVHQFAAKKAVQDLEEGRGWLQGAKTKDQTITLKAKYASRFDELVEREAVRLGEKLQVAGKWCSFVAVRESGEAKKTGPEASPEPGFATFGSGPRRQLGGFAARQSVTPATSRAAPAVLDAAACMPLADESDGDDAIAEAKDEEAEESDDDMGFGLFDGGNTPPQRNRFLKVEAEEDEDAGHTGAAFGGAEACLAPVQTGFGGGLLDAPRGAQAGKKKASPSGLQSSGPQLESSYASFGLSTSPAFGGFVSGIQPPQPKGDTLHLLIALQKFDGSWGWGDALFKLLGQTPSFDPSFGTEELMASALAVGFLEKKMAGRKEVWEMVVEKARAWMAGQAGNGRVEELVFKAKGGLA